MTESNETMKEESSSACMALGKNRTMPDESKKSTDRKSPEERISEEKERRPPIK